MRSPPGPRHRDLVREFHRIDARLSFLDRRIGAADFRMYTGKGDERESVRWQEARASYLLTPPIAAYLRQVASHGAPPSLRRPSLLLRRAALDASVEQSPRVVRLRTRLQSRIVRYRPLWHGRRVGRAVVHDVLWNSPNREERRRAWLADEPLRRSLEPALRGLIAVRNELARDRGFRNFAELRLAFEGLTPSRLRRLARPTVGALRPHVRALHDQAASEGRLDGWAPWDLRWAEHRREKLADELFPGRRMVGVVDRALRAWGLPRSEGRFRIVRCDIPFGGLTISVDPPSDVRVLVHPRGEWNYYMVLFHELGHAVHAASADGTTHLGRTLDPGYAAFSEGIATVFERIADDAEWLATVPGVTPEAARRFAAKQGSNPALSAPAYLLAFEGELALYERPDRNPGPAMAALARKWYGYDEHPSLSWADPFRVTHPIYIQSYLLAFLFDAQVREAMLRATSGPMWPNRRAGPWLIRSFLRPGARYDWLDRVREVTGAPLSARPFLRAARSAA